MTLHEATTLVGFGGELKALGDGKIGGYLVKFSSADDPDLAGDFFTPETNFGKHQTTPVLFEHGMDETLKRRIFDDDADLKQDEFGVWVEAQLEMRDAYEQFLYSMAEGGKLGWSSGTAAHLVERKRVGKGHQMLRWPLGLDASLTLTPMEPRAEAIPLRSYMELPAVQENLKALREGFEPKADAKVDPADAQKSVSVPIIKNMESEAMEAKDMELIEGRFGSIENALKATGETLEALVAKLTKPGPDAGFAVPEDQPEAKPGPFKSLGEQLMSVVAAGRKGGHDVDERLYEVKALGANESIPSEGGFLVQQDYSSEIFKRAYDSAVMASRCRKLPISAASNGARINAIDETSRVLGSRWGGVQAYWLNEAGTKVASKPKFRQMDLKLEKLIAVCYATDEVLADAALLEAIVREALTDEIRFMVDKAIYEGTGAGQPLGVMNSPALVTTPKEAGQAAATVVSENIVKMWARMWAPSRANSAWFVNQDVEPQLDMMGLTVGLGGVPTYLPAGGLADAPYGRLKGRPVIPFENCSTVGTLGDILLADLGQYLMIDKGDIQAASSIHVQFLTDETAFRFVYRVDGQPVWNAPLTPAKGTNTLSPFVTLAARA
jgi:HK97 family phage major capsid protein